MSPPVRAQLPAGGRLTVDLAALADNWRQLARLAAPAETGAAVKGDAYGVGLEAAASALWRAGCRSYFVALPAEGVRLRALLPQATIYVLNGLFDGAAAGFVAHRLRPVLGSRAEVDAWAAEALSRNDLDELAAFRCNAPGLPFAHPTVEHFTPLFVTLGAADGAIATPIEGYAFGLSKRSLQVS